MPDAIGEVLERKNIAALVRFVREPVEDHTVSASLNGALPTKDVEYVYITPPYSSGNSEMVKKAKPWIEECFRKAKNGQMDPRHAESYQRQYEAWKQGLEIPEDGTPIRGWPMLTPAQQENCIRLKIPTVEYLAEATADGLKALGMGSLDLKRKAIAWLAQAKDKGPLTLEIAAVRRENDALKVSMETLKEQVQSLIAQGAKPSKRARKDEDDAA